jgi:hypothetical protein
MNHYLILRLTNAAIDLDQRGQGNLAALLTEAINELLKQAALIGDLAVRGPVKFGGES